MDFNDRCTFPDVLDASKRVRYSHGLVLGVGELKTEQNFLLGRQYGHHRRLHGYGTGAGLAVEIVEQPDGIECRVHPGWGIDPAGHDICVEELQCAKLNEWLSQQAAAGDLSSALDTSGTTSVEAFVVLCYRECETDKVPIPVGPCLSLDKALVPSRIQAAFELALHATPPAQVEEDVARRLGDLLSRVSIAAGPGGLTTPDALVAEVRALAAPAPAADSTPSTPSGVDLALDPMNAEEILRTALRVFVTEVRPALVPDGGACLDGPRDQTCLLLARLIFDVTSTAGGPVAVPGSVIVDESRRPLLLPTRLLQEAMLSDMLPGAAGTSAAPPFVTVTGGGGPIFAPAPAPSPAPPPAAAPPPPPSLITLRPSAASPTGLASAATFGAGIPSLRFRRNGTAVFPFSVPAGVTATDSARLRLQWAFHRVPPPAPPPANIPLAWVASLRLHAADDDLTAPVTPAGQVTITAQTPETSDGRLLTTDFVTLPRGATTQPTLGFLTLALHTNDPVRPDLALPQALEIHLIVAELELSHGGSP